VPAKRVIDTTLKIIEIYKRERATTTTTTTTTATTEADNYETLHEWIIRLTKGQGSGSIKNLEDMKAALAEIIQLPPPQENIEVYQDYGSDSRFSAKTARGECAA